MKINHFVRGILSIILLYFIYFEVGVATFIAIVLIMVGQELTSFTLAQHFKILKKVTYED